MSEDLIEPHEPVADCDCRTCACAERNRLRLRLEEATMYARMLAVNMHARNYPEVPQWRPLRELMGLLTQIDNMTAGLRIDERECGS